MSKLAELATIIWNYKLSLAPVLVTYLIFDSPALIRKFTSTAYVPIYFIFFPSGRSDHLYAQYFNEDYMYQDGALMNEDEKRALRHRIQATAILSMVFATIIAPWLSGFFSAFYLTSNQFFEFLAFLLASKSIFLVWVLFKLRLESLAAKKSFPLIVTMYVVYLLLVARGLTKSFEWTSTALQSKGLAGVIWGILDYGYADFFLNAIIVSAITWGITTLFAHPANIPKNEQYVE